MILVFIIGLAFGSFANVLIRRLPRNELNLWTRSHCFNCTHQLRCLELIPLISWCLQKGRCKHCNHPISLLYPLLEGIIAISFVVCFKISSSLLTACLLSLLSYLFILVIVIDVREKLILDSMNILIALTILCLDVINFKNVLLNFSSLLATLVIALGLKIAFSKIKNVHAL